MDFLKYYIKDSGAFAPFISTMEDAGADDDGFIRSYMLEPRRK